MTSYFVHPKAICESAQIGAGTRIGAFAHVLPGARIGRECDLSDGVIVESDVLVGDRVTVKCGVQLLDGITLEDDVFIGPNATFTNDPFPRSKVFPEQFMRTSVRRGASIGANATILPGIEIGPGAMVGAGAVVTRSVPPNAIVVGNPAKFLDTSKQYGERTTPLVRPPSRPQRDTRSCHGPGRRRATLHVMRLVKDLRGELTVGSTNGTYHSLQNATLLCITCPRGKFAASTLIRHATISSFASAGRATYFSTMAVIGAK